MTEATPTDVINNNFEAAKTAISNCAPISLVQTVNGKQDVISDLTTIRANATAGAGAASTISGYGDIVTHNASEFLTSHQDISGKADKATTLAGYGITNAYTKTEADTAISTAIAGASHLKRLIVTQLPSPSSADENTVYMVLKSSGATGNIYDEYLLISNDFEKIGDTQVDLSGYVTSVNNVNPVNGNVTLSIPSAVTESTVSGWGFTKNAGTVQKVNNVSPVNGNVSLTIPTVPTVVSAFTNDSGYITEISSSDVTTALGYTPYNSSNPSGYQANVIETIKVNGTAQTVTTKTVDISIPTAQTVGDGALTIKRNGTAVGTFTANQTSASTINISVPTTATEVGALPSTTVIGDGKTIFKKNGTAFATITANQTSTVNIDYTIPTVPTNVSAFTNDSGYITNSALSGYQTTANLVTSVSASSTNSQYPSAKLFYDTCGDIETLINAL